MCYACRGYGGKDFRRSGGGDRGETLNARSLSHGCIDESARPATSRRVYCRRVPRLICKLGHLGACLDPAGDLAVWAPAGRFLSAAAMGACAVVWLALAPARIGDPRPRILAAAVAVGSRV